MFCKLLSVNSSDKFEDAFDFKATTIFTVNVFDVILLELPLTFLWNCIKDTFCQVRLSQMVVPTTPHVSKLCPQSNHSFLLNTIESQYKY